MHFDPFRLDDTSGEWRELRLGLCGRSGTTRTPFFNMDGFYANGNYELDPASLQGFVLGTMTPSDRRGETTSGSLLIDEIACIEDAGADPCAEPTNRTGTALNEVQFDAAAASEVHGTDGWRHDVPDEASRRAFARQRSTMQSFRHLPQRSLSSHSTAAELAFRRMPSRSTGGSSMLSPSLAGSPPRRSASTASARSARLFLGPRSLGAE